MSDRTRPSGLIYALGALCAGAIVAAFLVVGPSSQSATLQTRVVKVQQGVVQSTVSGSGNIQAATQLNLGFKTSGVVQKIYVSAGQQVTDGQLLAELDPQSAEVTLEQAKATLQASEATLTQLEEDEGESSTGSAGSGSGTSSKATASAAGASPGASSPAGGAPASTTPAASSPSGGAAPTGTSTSPTTTTHARTGSPAATTPSTPTSTTPAASSEKPKQSAATREANLASARAAVRSDKLAVQNDEQAVSNTKLYAPTSGTIVSLSGEVGETVSGGGTSKASSTASSSSGAGSSGSGAAGGASSSGRSAASGAASSSSASGATGGSSSTAFAVLSDLSTLELVVPLSESEIVHVHVGQPATVTVEALEGLKLAAHVIDVASLSTSNSGVVSYDVTFQLDQSDASIKPGMSTSAEVVVKQEEGLNVPTSAISGKAVTVVHNGKQTRQSVVTGLVGNSSTIILSGLNAGQEIAIPLASTSSATSITSRLAGRAGSGLGGGLGGPGLAGGFAFRGGG
ncbi:MAG TPA: biotin/lipoyl-binding protein [Solirubrobacteraceae bacterium]|nr:biotin/lipoyl-binding protein [Solirubrobacteraceae bacterium]